MPAVRVACVLSSVARPASACGGAGAGQMTKLAPFPEPAEELLGVAANGKLYVFCGLAPRLEADRDGLRVRSSHRQVGEEEVDAGVVASRCLYRVPREDLRVRRLRIAGRGAGGVGTGGQRVGNTILSATRGKRSLRCQPSAGRRLRRWRVTRSTSLAARRRRPAPRKRSCTRRAHVSVGTVEEYDPPPISGDSGPRCRPLATMRLPAA